MVNPTEKVLTNLAPILFISGSVIIALQVVKVLYKNNNKEKSVLWCNVPIPANYQPTQDFYREFQVEYLFPVAIFPQEDYLRKIAVKAGTSELEVFRNFVFYQTTIVRLTDRISYLIISVLIFNTNLRLCQLTLTQILGSAVITSNNLATGALAYLLAFGLTAQVCLIVLTFLQFIVYIVFSIIKFLTGKIKTENISFQSLFSSVFPDYNHIFNRDLT